MNMDYPLYTLFLLMFIRLSDSSCCHLRDCNWTEWGQWSHCSVIGCGQSGTQRRVRSVSSSCIGVNPVPCLGEPEEIRACPGQCGNTDSCCSFDGCHWTEWNSWSACSATDCSMQGKQQRMRGMTPQCVGAVPSPCGGQPFEERACARLNNQGCSWQSWSSWGACSVSKCGETGSVRRTRVATASCTGYAPFPCSGQSFEEISCTGGCQKTSCCSVSGCVWSAWSSWNSCSAQSCGVSGTRSRQRATSGCVGQYPFPCQGSDTEISSCTIGCSPSTSSCSTSSWCTWTAWSSWSSCPSGCGGTKTRQRKGTYGCSTGKSYPCKGQSSETGSCGCVQVPDSGCTDPSGCYWTEWNLWGACTEGGCGSQGRQVRSRQATSPCSPIPCSGEPTEGRSCHVDCGSCCPISRCQWGSWGSWTQCAVGDCQKQKSKSRQRQAIGCEGPRPLPCAGSSTESLPCSCQSPVSPCADPSGCLWEQWGAWSLCTEGGCGSDGRQVRSRKASAACINIPCLGEPTEGRPCTANCETCCPISGCSWTPWTSWSTCPTSACKQQRQRYPSGCIGQNPFPCQGSRTESLPCGTGGCGQGPVGCNDPDGCFWTEWGQWSACTEGGCGSQGRQVRSRRATSLCSPIPCFGEPTEGRPCMSDCGSCCPLSACSWGQWGPWSSCSPTACKQAETKNRRREPIDCIGPNPFPCEGSQTQSQPCTGGECVQPSGCTDPPGCVWTQWAPWGICIEGGCGSQGRQIRSRQPTSACGSTIPCLGEPTQGQSCSIDCTNCCPLAHCEWTNWGPWSPCSSNLCKVKGSQTRTRGVSAGCAGSKPSPCSGANMEARPCEGPCEGPSCCSVSGCSWQSWNAWSECSIIGCDSYQPGNQWRNRQMSSQCVGAQPQPCSGNGYEQRSCRSHCSGI